MSTVPSPAVNSLFPYSKSTTALILSAIIGSFLTGCGGGGGGSDSAATPAPAPAPETVQLAIDSNNAVDAATSSLGYSELAFEFGEAALTVIDETSKQSTFPATTACDGGTQIDDFIDNDSNHVPSPGDVLKTTYNHCHDTSLNGTISGTITLTLTTPPTSAYTTKWSGKIEFSNFEIILDDEPSVLIGLSGGISFNSSADLVTSILDIATPASGFNISAQSNSRNITEKIIVNSGRKTLHYDQARYSFELNAIMQSQIMGGSANVQTTTPISGQLVTLPDTGALRISGNSNSSADFTSGVGTNSGQATLIVSTPSTTQTVGTLVQWTELSDGYVWSDPVNPNGNYYANMPPAYFSMLYTNIPTGSSVNTVPTANPEFKIQFNKPVDENDLPAMQFIEQNYVSTPNAIATDIEVHGALIVVRPHTQLNHATQYWLIANDPFKSLDTQSSYIPSYGITTPSTLSAQIGSTKQYGFPGDSVTLDSYASQSTIGALTYEWTQISGQPVILSGNTNSNTSFFVPSLPSGTNLLKFKLKVTAPNGEYETNTFEFAAYPSPQDVDLFYYVYDTGISGAPSTTKLITIPPFVRNPIFTSNGIGIAYQNAANTSYAWLLFAGVNYATLQVGQYTGATSPFNTNAPYLWVVTNASNCNTSMGAFNIMEISYKGDGSLNTFAADFIQPCNASPSTIRGAIRIHSAIPLPTTWPF